MSAPEVFREATKRGLRLEPRGDKLAVIPAHRVPPDFADVLRRHKRELLDLLETKSANLPTDCAPWLNIARQVLDGEFSDADRTTVESLTVGLRNIKHPRCQRAMQRLSVMTIRPKP